MENNQTTTWLDTVISLSPFIVAIFALLGGFLSARLAYRYSVKKLRQENRTTIELEKYKAILRANERCFSLIAFMTEVENDRSIVTSIRESKEDTYFFHPKRFELFMNELRIIYFDEGQGLYLSPEAQSYLFHNRNLLFGLNIIAKKQEETSQPMVITNEGMVKAIFANTEKLRETLKTNILLNANKVGLQKIK